MISFKIFTKYQSIVSIKTNCSILAKQLKIMYGDYINHTTDNNTHTITAIKINNTYNIVFNNEKFTTDLPIIKIEEIIKRSLIHNNHFALHGSAIEHNGKGYIFAAASSTGKTTLVSYLSSKGFGYITDDCVMINKKTFEITSCHPPIHLREGGVSTLREYNALPSKTEILDTGLSKRYVYTPKNRVDGSIPIKMILFIERSPSENKIISMSTTESTIQLMKSPIIHYELSREYISFIAQLAQFPCRKIIYKDMNYIIEGIRYGFKNC